MTTDSIDWARWHRPYRDVHSPLSVRLDVVRQHLRQRLSAAPPGRITAVSIRAGQGQDLLGAMVDHPRRGDVSAVLVESDPYEAAIAATAAAELGLDGVEVIVGDPGHIDTYAEVPRADLVVCCGVFGHLPDAAIRRTVAMLPQLCAPGGTVVWTCHREAPDLTGWIRDWFAHTGFTESRVDNVGRRVHRHGGPPAVTEEDWSGFLVGSHTLVAPPRPPMRGARMFTLPTTT